MDITDVAYDRYFSGIFPVRVLHLQETVIIWVGDPPVS